MLARMRKRVRAIARTLAHAPWRGSWPQLPSTPVRTDRRSPALMHGRNCTHSAHTPTFARDKAFTCTAHPHACTCRECRRMPAAVQTPSR
eukprot:5249274-Pleurochrysis_carterae.AAC.2